MKKQLLTTTALVTAGILVSSGAVLAQQKASKPSLTIGGWVEGIVGAADNDTAVVGSRVGWDSQYDSEFHFNGSVTLDNGIRINTRAELEGEVSGDQWDEAYMTISGSFGQIAIGSQDNAAHKMITPISGSWGTQVGQNLSLDIGDWVVNPGITHRTVRLDIGDGDGNKINYFTPRIEGFQLGVSYLPSFEECAASGTTNTACNSSIATTSTSPHNGWAAAVSFDRKFDQVRTAIGVGYVTAVQPTGRVVGADPGGDPKGWSVGALLGYQGFTIAAGYKQERNRLNSTTNALTSNDVNVLDVGVGYKWGKNGVSLGYEHTETPASKLVAGDDETDFIMASYRRELGPGVQYRLNLMHADYQGEAAGSADDNDGYAITTSVRVAF